MHEILNCPVADPSPNHPLRQLALRMAADGATVLSSAAELCLGGRVCCRVGQNRLRNAVRFGLRAPHCAVPATLARGLPALGKISY
eukprot:7381855-Prymnesium_polylepis.1